MDRKSSAAKTCANDVAQQLTQDATVSAQDELSGSADDVFRASGPTTAASATAATTVEVSRLQRLTLPMSLQAAMPSGTP